MNWVKVPARFVSGFENRGLKTKKGIVGINTFSKSVYNPNRGLILGSKWYGALTLLRSRLLTTKR